MANIIFKVDTFFKGSDNFDQLFKIIRVLGEDDLHDYVHRYDLKIPSEVKKLMRGQSWEKVPFQKFVSHHNKEMASPDAIDLVSRMLVYDKNERIGVQEALDH